MEHYEAGRILRSLADGRDPTSGKDLPDETVLHQPQVIRALLIAQRSIDSCIAREKRRAVLPERVGIQWTDVEDEKLTAAFKAGATIESLAEIHKRTPRAVQARLERLQLIAVNENASFWRFPGEAKPEP
jgi:hypothetical protein